MNNREMIKTIRASKIVLVPVLTKHDVIHLRVTKSELISELEVQGLDKECPWSIVDNYGGTITLDVA